MKRTGLLLISAALVMCLAAGCRNGKPAPAAAPEEEPAPVENFFTTIEKYLTTDIGANYTPGEFTIPCYSYTVIDDSDPEDIRVMGDFWVYNYKLSGDTLETVSGGNHPGKFHLKKDADGHYTVTGFDAVEDGSQYLPTARKIFGDYFEELIEAQSNDEVRDHARARAIADYVRDHEIPAKYYKDFGWPAVAIPSAE